MSEQWNKGDVVQLKSGGPRMTVSQVGEHLGAPMVWCVWFDGQKKYEDTFAPELLAKPSSGVRSVPLRRG